MRIASESVADNELCPFNALASALTAGRRMTAHMDMLRRSNRKFNFQLSTFNRSLKVGSTFNRPR
jgi:hypothetical protein